MHREKFAYIRPDTNACILYLWTGPQMCKAQKMIDNCVVVVVVFLEQNLLFGKKNTF